MNEDLIAILSNLGAINEEKAVSLEVLANSSQFQNVDLKNGLKELESKGYIVRSGEELYLTGIGLLRALSGIS